MTTFADIKQGDHIRLTKHVIAAFKGVRARVFETNRSLYPADMKPEDVNRPTHAYLMVQRIDGDLIVGVDIVTRQERTFERKRAHQTPTNTYNEVSFADGHKRPLDFWGWDQLCKPTPKEVQTVVQTRLAELTATAAQAQSALAAYQQATRPVAR